MPCTATAEHVPQSGAERGGRPPLHERSFCQGDIPRHTICSAKAQLSMGVRFCCPVFTLSKGYS